MHELDECLRLSRQIIKNRESLEELKALSMSPKSQIITDMPKGGGMNINIAENYLIKMEKLEKDYIDMCGNRAEKWKKAVEIFEEHHQPKENTKMLWFRFYAGYSWKKCASHMAEAFPNSNWSVDKCFRVYRRIMYNIND